MYSASIVVYHPASVGSTSHQHKWLTNHPIILFQTVADLCQYQYRYMK